MLMIKGSNGGRVNRGRVNRIRLIWRRTSLVSVLIALTLPAPLFAQVMGDAPDISQDFQKMEQIYFIGSQVKAFDPATGAGTLEWARYLRQLSLSFNKLD